VIFWLLLHNIKKLSHVHYGHKLLSLNQIQWNYVRTFWTRSKIVLCRNL